MASEDRAAFERVVIDECERISVKLDHLGGEIRGHMLGRWPMADIYVSDLLKMLGPSLAEHGLRVSLVGLPLWVHGDSLSLIQALEVLIRKISEVTGTARFEAEPMLGDHRVYLDLVWEGAPVPAGTLERWLDVPVQATWRASVCGMSWSGTVRSLGPSRPTVQAMLCCACRCSSPTGRNSSSSQTPSGAAGVLRLHADA
jgi:hypothetical protein